MGCQNAGKLGCLDDQEAWALFEKKAGLENSDEVDIKEVVGQIVKKCDGLPIAIVTLESALRGNTNCDRWKAMYRRLKERRLDDIQGIEQNAYRYHEVYVEELVRYAWGLELYKSVDSIEEVRSEVLAAVDILKNSCLLLDFGERHVKMHDVVRNVALWIASGRKETSFSIKSEVVEAWREDESFEPYTALFFKTNRIDELPKELIHPYLKILKLLGHHGVFGRMKVCSLDDRLIASEAFQFQTLHLERCKLVDISIIGKLTNLRTLHLECCQLLEISIVGKLKKLQVLSFSGSDIKELPEEIGDLNNLKLLDLSHCESLQKNPCHLIQRMSKLEEVYLAGCASISWATENTTPRGKVTSCDNIQVLFQTVELGSAQLALNQNVSMKSLKFVEIDGCNRLTYLFPAIVADSLGQLETLKISNCLGLNEIIQETEASNRSLQNLRKVGVRGCNNLKSLSSLSPRLDFEEFDF
ncbi:hypothetical protein PTKIN_Ptkin14bG0155600 [Pterospermum kingtungense]